MNDLNEGAWVGAETRSRLFFENKEIFHPRNDISQDDIPVIADVLNSLFFLDLKRNKFTHRVTPPWWRKTVNAKYLLANLVKLLSAKGYRETTISSSSSSNNRSNSNLSNHLSWTALLIVSNSCMFRLPLSNNCTFLSKTFLHYSLPTSQFKAKRMWWNQDLPTSIPKLSPRLILR